MLSLINNNLGGKKLNQINEHLQIERKNLINLFKLVIKNLIESSSASSKTNENYWENTKSNLNDFFDVFENIIDHGFKGSKKGFYSSFNRHDYSSILNIAETKFDYLNFKTIKDIIEIKTSLGKFRAWIRILLMQKQLANYFNLLIQEKELLAELYETEAILLSEESNMIAGLLIGLSALDFSIDMKSELDVLDEPLQLLKYSNYLREKIPELENTEFEESVEKQNKKLYELLDQKNYIEEINKKLKSESDITSKRLIEVETSNEFFKNELMKFKLENLQLKSMIERIESEKLNIESEFKLKYDSLYQDQAIERETFEISKSGLDQMYIELQKKILEETKIKTSYENEIKVQQIMKNELEVALKLMDHNLVEKQTSINKLRDQLEQIKTLNLDLNTQLQSITTKFNDVKQRNETLKNENEMLKKQAKDKENYLNEKMDKFEKNSNDLLFFQKKKIELEVDLSIEKNWRQELQDELDKKSILIKSLSKDSQKLAELKKEYEKSKIELSNMKLNNLELEKTLEEMGSKLGVSQIKMEDFKEVTKQFSEYQWEQDDAVTICKLCNKEFNVARRKHHVRKAC